MRELGRAGARARRRPDPELERESLKTYLRREVPPREVWAALKTAMEGSNQAAAVSAARVLLAALEEPEREEQRGAEAKANAERFEQLVRAQAIRARRAGSGLVEAEKLWQAARELWHEAGGETAGGALVTQDVSAAEAVATLEGLEQMGLIRRPLSAGERDELAEKDAEIARLKTALSEFAGATA